MTGTSLFTVVSVDGVELGMMMGGSSTSAPATISFEKNVVVKYGSQHYGKVLIQLAN